MPRPVNGFDTDASENDALPASGMLAVGVGKPAMALEQGASLFCDQHAAVEHLPRVQRIQPIRHRRHPLIRRC